MNSIESTDQTIARTPNVNCPACNENRLHTDAEREQYHPFAGHGFAREQGGWTHPDLKGTR